MKSNPDLITKAPCLRNSPKSVAAKLMPLEFMGTIFHLLSSAVTRRAIFLEGLISATVSPSLSASFMLTLIAEASNLEFSASIRETSFKAELKLFKINLPSVRHSSVTGAGRINNEKN